MNYLDIKNNKKQVIIKNHSVVVTNTSGFQGLPGKNGDTPYIGDNGHWFISGKDTGVKSVGDPGHTPIIDPSSKHWFIAGEDTGILAEGKNGVSPHIGANGNWFVGPDDTGIAAGVSKEEIFRVQYFGSKFEFPAIGNTLVWCVAMDTNSIYRWDEKNMRFYQLLPDISVIYCGNSTGDNELNDFVNNEIIIMG